MNLVLVRPLGSPPRMRGKAAKSEDAAAIDRITPACAGKSHVLPRSAQVQWDHPRVCGEKKKAEEMGATTKGSPPRVRGKAFHPVGRDVGVGITPAYAGKRIKLRKRHSICGDHPRMCGEKLVTEFITRYMMGSPLRVRGKVGPVIQLRAGPGITPAYAGKRNQHHRD